MSTPTKAPNGQVPTAATSSHDLDTKAPDTTLKAVAKTLQKLAGQLTEQQAKLVKAAQPTAKSARKALAAELTAALQPYLGLEGMEDKRAPKGITKTVNHLAALLAKQRQKQTKKATKNARKAATLHDRKATLVPMLTLVRPPAPNVRTLADARALVTPKPAVPKTNLVPTALPAVNTTEVPTDSD